VATFYAARSEIITPLPWLTFALPFSSGTAVKPADLLLNITGGSMGRCCRIPNDFAEANVSQHVAIIRSALPSMADFLHRLVLSPYFQAFIFGEQTGAGRGGLPKNRMDRIAIALPPLAEQHRIVAKVDALMALCDQLETALTTTATTRQCLLDTLIRRALFSNKTASMEANE
jgi:type I restriction enzyme, S subunit